MNFIILILSQFRTKLLAVNHLIIQERTKLDIEYKSLKNLLEIITLVSSANNIGSNTEFIFRGRSFIYMYILRTTEALELILGELHVSIYPKQRKHFELK